MQEIPSLLTVADIRSIFGVSRVSVYRWVSEARAGKSQFPEPLFGYKRRLLWSRSSIVQFCESQPQTMAPQQSVVPNPKKGRRSAKEQGQRRENTRQILERHRVIDTNDSNRQATGESGSPNL
jgi:predicted DNA-binding transcriptional regulator AlpA